MIKKILIAGANSYIGTNFVKYLEMYPDQYSTETIDMRNDLWKEKDFSEYDIIFHVAAIVHKKEKPEMKELYYNVNKTLPIEIAKKAKSSGVKQFIFMSTMAVYGEEGKLGEEIVINKNTTPNPKTYYAKSKLEAEDYLKLLADEQFIVAILRPPMVYGPNCPGNYATLEKLSRMMPLFPMIENNRSMINIINLCHYVKEYMDNESSGLFLPQDDEYVNTSILVKALAKKNGKKIILLKWIGFLIRIVGKNTQLVNKVFGNLMYEKY